MKSHQLERRAMAFDYLFEAVIITNHEGIITDWNRGAERAFGYTFDEVVGQSMGNLLAQDEAEQTIATIMRVVDESGKWKGELRTMPRNNRPGWAEVMVVPIIENKRHTGVIWVIRDITEKVMTEMQLKALEYYDSLTGIPNRFVLYDRLQQMINTARRNQLMFSVYFIDLDHFKHINDAAGYSAGDAVLREVAQRMQSVLRESDTVARVGSDEFVVLALDIRQPKDAWLVADNILRAFNGVIMVDDQEFRVSASIGFSVYPRDGITCDELLIRADEDMLRQKKMKAEAQA